MSERANGRGRGYTLEGVTANKTQYGRRLGVDARLHFERRPFSMLHAHQDIESGLILEIAPLNTGVFVVAFEVLICENQLPGPRQSKSTTCSPERRPEPYRQIPG